MSSNGAGPSNNKASAASSSAASSSAASSSAASSSAAATSATANNSTPAGNASEPDSSSDYESTPPGSKGDKSAKGKGRRIPKRVVTAAEAEKLRAQANELNQKATEVTEQAELELDERDFLPVHTTELQKYAQQLQRQARRAMELADAAEAKVAKAARRKDRRPRSIDQLSDKEREIRQKRIDAQRAKREPDQKKRNVLLRRSVRAGNRAIRDYRADEAEVHRVRRDAGLAAEEKIRRDAEQAVIKSSKEAELDVEIAKLEERRAREQQEKEDNAVARKIRMERNPGFIPPHVTDQEPHPALPEADRQLIVARLLNYTGDFLPIRLMSTLCFDADAAEIFRLIGREMLEERVLDLYQMELDDQLPEDPEERALYYQQRETWHALFERFQHATGWSYMTKAAWNDRQPLDWVRHRGSLRLTEAQRLSNERIKQANGDIEALREIFREVFLGQDFRLTRSRALDRWDPPKNARVRKAAKAITAAVKAPVKAAVKTAVKAPAQTPVKTPAQTPAKTPAKQPVKKPVKKGGNTATVGVVDPDASD
jgi:hypothetical protein